VTPWPGKPHPEQDQIGPVVSGFTGGRRWPVSKGRVGRLTLAAMSGLDK